MQLIWMEGEGAGLAMNIEEGSMQYDWEPDVTSSDNTLSCTFDVVGSDYTNQELWGYSTEYVEAGDMNSEWWGDWAPETYSPYWGEDVDGDGDGDVDGEGDSNDQQKPTTETPGFEILAVIAAIGITLIIFRRERK